MVKSFCSVRRLLVVLASWTAAVCAGCGSSELNRSAWVEPASSRLQSNLDWASQQLRPLEVPATPEPSPPQPKPWSLPRVSVDFTDAPARVVCETVGQLAGVGVVVPEAAVKQTLTITAADEPAESVIRRAASLLGYVPTLDAGVVIFVEKKGAVERVAVIRSHYVDVKEAELVLRGVAGDNAQVTVFGDRVVVAGTDAAVRRVEELRPYFDSGPDGWYLECRLVRVSRSLASRIGIEWTLNGTARLDVNSGTGWDGPIFGPRATALVQAVASASADDSQAELLYSAPLVVLENGDATLTNGETIPVPRRTVSDQGTVTTSGYDQVQTGFTFTAKAKRVEGGVLLTLHPSLSAVTGYVEGAPIVVKSEVTGACVVRSGEWVVLGGLESTERSDVGTGGPGVMAPPLFGKSVKRIGEGRLLFCVRASRVFASGKAVP